MHELVLANVYSVVQKTYLFFYLTVVLQTTSFYNIEYIVYRLPR